ncbi:hypothetical protein LXL04_012667 [Taraxacum kok-saghyz]
MFPAKVFLDSGEISKCSRRIMVDASFLRANVDFLLDGFFSVSLLQLPWQIVTSPMKLQVLVSLEAFVADFTYKSLRLRLTEDLVVSTWKNKEEDLEKKTRKQKRRKLNAGKILKESVEDLGFAGPEEEDDEREEIESVIPVSGDCGVSNGFFWSVDLKSNQNMLDDKYPIKYNRWIELIQSNIKLDHFDSPFDGERSVDEDGADGGYNSNDVPSPLSPAMVYKSIDTGIANLNTIETVLLLIDASISVNFEKIAEVVDSTIDHASKAPLSIRTAPPDLCRRGQTRLEKGDEFREMGVRDGEWEGGFEKLGEISWFKREQIMKTRTREQTWSLDQFKWHFCNSETTGPPPAPTTGPPPDHRRTTAGPPSDHRRCTTYTHWHIGPPPDHRRTTTVMTLIYDADAEADEEMLMLMNV